MCIKAPHTVYSISLRGGLEKWTQACGFQGDPDSIPIKDLPPHYSKLLHLLESQYLSGLVTPTTACSYLAALHSFFQSHQQGISGCGHMPVVLSSLDAALRKFIAYGGSYHQLGRFLCEVKADSSCAACGRTVVTAAAAASKPVATAAGAPAGAAAAAAAAAAVAAAAPGHAAAAVNKPRAAAAAAITAGSNSLYSPDMSFAQLFQQLGSSGCANGIDVLVKLARSVADTAADSEVAPVLLLYTGPELLQAFRVAASTGSLAKCMQVCSTLNGLLQLLVRPELDAVLEADVRQERLAAVSSVRDEVAASLQQQQQQHTSPPLVARSMLLLAPATPASGRLLPPLPPQAGAQETIGAALAERQQQQEQQQQQQKQQQQYQQQQHAQLGTKSLAAAGSSHSPVGMPVGVNCACQIPGTASDSVTAAAASTAEYSCDGSAAAAAVAGAAAGRSMSIAAFLEQLSAPNLWARPGSLTDCLEQLQETAGVFTGVSLHDIPASLVVTNYISETGDRAQQCLEAAAGATVQQDGTGVTRAGAAQCNAVVCAVEGLLQLAVQPALRQLFSPQQQQELMGGLVTCKQQLLTRMQMLGPSGD